ncbi:MAG: ABC transporter ATP-binding protein [Gammaproteobacteria bacterium]
MSLTLDNVSCHYASVQILHGISLTLDKGEILGMLGRNGAGKTTTLKAIMGLIRVRTGSISLDQNNISTLPAHEVPKLGVAYVPQGRRLFSHLSVQENLEMGLLVRNSGQDILAWALDLFPELKPRLRQRAGTLSGGQQQMVATARALCTQPDYLLLDEPSEGLQPSLVETILQTASTLKQQGVGVLLVEQKVDAVLRIADRVVFLENGSLPHESTPQALEEDPEPLLHYVGVRHGA